MKQKFVCVEAVASEDGKHVACLVSENGHYVGVGHRDREQLPERIKLKHWRYDQAPTVSLIERFVPKKQVRRMSRDIMKAIGNGSLKVHLPPKSKDKNANPWILADDFAEARKVFGMAKKPPTEKERAAHQKKQEAAKKKEEDAKEKSAAASE